MDNLLCPCKSLKNYEDCCAPYHQGKLPENALILMRSRYSAYALQLPHYIMETTHSSHPDHHIPPDAWEKAILAFSQNTVFKDLKILEFVAGDTTAFVTFTAILSQQGRDASFTEKSQFLKEKGKWYYLKGEMIL